MVSRERSPDHCFYTSYFWSHIHETYLHRRKFAGTLEPAVLTEVTVLTPGLGCAVEAGRGGDDGGVGLTLLRGEVARGREVGPGQPRHHGVQLGVCVARDELLQQVLGEQLLLGLGHVCKYAFVQTFYPVFLFETYHHVNFLPRPQLEAASDRGY